MRALPIEYALRQTKCRGCRDAAIRRLHVPYGIILKCERHAFACKPAADPRANNRDFPRVFTPG